MTFDATAACDVDADARLMALVRLGDRAAFRQLYDRYAGEVFAVCLRVLDNHADAEDAAAEVFCEVWQRRERYDGRRAGPRTYLVLLARSRAIDRLRSRRARLDRNNSPSFDEVLHPTTAGAATGPDAQVVRAELADRVRAALAELDQRQRTALDLAFFEGLSHREVAERLGAPLGTVKTHIRKGLAKLRYSISGGGQLEEQLGNQLDGQGVTP